MNSSFFRSSSRARARAAGFAVIAAACLAVAVPAVAEGLDVTVAASDGTPLVGALCALPEIKRETTSDAQGLCRFENVSAGHYDVTVRLAGYASARKGVDVAPGQGSLTFKLRESYHFSESVSVGVDSTDTFEAFQPATVLGGEELQGRIGTSLGETLASQPGVNLRAFGPGPARPVIRGFDGDRVLVIENGARTGDLSSQSGDHGVTLDPASATQIEVVRGAATLLYGSNALGGVVNLVSDEIPTRPVKGAHGALTLQGATADELFGGAGNLTLGNGKWAFRLAGSANRTSDVRTPDGDLHNSQSDSKSGGGALAYTGDKGYLGASYAYVDTRYGIPFVEEGETTLHPRRHRVDVRGERRGLSGFIEGVKFVGGYRDYKHDEIEGDGTVATSFANKFGEAQLLLNHRPSGRLKGTFGLWGTHRDYSIAGEEALAPATKQDSFAAFVYEELRYHHFGLQFGGRVDRTDFDVEPEPAPERPLPVDRAFTEASGSLGLLGFLNDDVTVALNLSRAARNPSLEELYNYGPHPGNAAFEIGDPTLESEIGNGIDLSLRWRKPRFSGEVSLFSNWVDNFIFPLQTGAVEDGLVVVEYTARDSQLYGFEAHADVNLAEHWAIELGGDAVRGKVRATDEPLPRIPPYRGFATLRFETKGFHIEGELRTAAKQDRVYGAETETAGYAVFNLHASYRLIRGTNVHTFTLRFDNAGDTLYRNHLNYIKDLTPEMGRTVKALYSLRF